MPIVSRIGLLGVVRDKTTTEVRMAFVYSDEVTRASFCASGNVEAQSEMFEFEDLRGT
jgi:hypothetical protein